MIYLLLGLAAILLVWWWWKEDPTEPPEMPGKLPFLGHGLMMLGDSVDMFNAIKLISSEAERLGGATKLHLGPRKFYAVSDPEDCLTVLNECIQKHYIYNFARPLFANGILNADVPTWKRNRRLLNPAFNQQVLDGFIDIFNTRAASLVDEFEKEVGKPFDQEKYLRINNLETICSTSFGLPPEEYGNLQKNYLPLLEDVLHIFNIRIQKFWFHEDFIFNLSSLKRKQDEIVKRLDKFSDAILQKKKAEMNNPSYSESKPGKLRPFIDLITELAKDHPGFSDWQIRGETSTVIAGGHDTSASALTFGLAELGSHPEVQEKAYKEILEVLGDSKRFIEKDDLTKLTYIEAVAKEIVRLYPSVPVVARQLDKDIELKNSTLKAGYGCIVSVYGSGRHAMWGPDANEFRPERWFEKDTLPPAKYFAAFGLGRRSCIGKTYAIMAMKITLAHVMRSYTISSDVSEMVVKMDTMIRPEKGFYITLKQRV